MSVLPSSGLPSSGLPKARLGSPQGEVTVERRGSHEVADLQDFVSSLARADEPGLAVGIYSEGQLVRSAAAGCALPEHDVPVTEHTAFDIASVSKHMTSACVLLLARDGLVDLDSDIRASLPELSLTEPVTLRQCLTHTAGLRDYLVLCELAGIPVLGISENRAMDLIAGLSELDFAAGSAFSYSNTGYVLAAALVRRITGAGLARFARERVFGPLGMTATHFRDDVGALVPRLAGGYLADPVGRRGDGDQRGDGGQRDLVGERGAFRRCDVTETVVGDGSVVTSLADLAAWHGFMSCGAVLGADIRDRLLIGQALTDGTPVAYGLGLASIEVGGEPAWWHSGSWAGYRSAVIYLPDRRAGVSVLANRNDRYPSNVALATAEALVTGTDIRVCYAAVSGVPVPREHATREAIAVAGLWHEPAFDLFLELKARDGQLTASEQDDEHVFELCADGRWHGTGIAGGTTYTAEDGTLTVGWGLSASRTERYVRAELGPRRPSWPEVPAGNFVNEESRASAEVRASDSGGAEVAIGLATPRRLAPAGAGLWRTSDGGTVAVRVTDDGATLLISAPGVRHLRFERAADAAAGQLIPRGLRGGR
jgi:CubicO group peptidase (beta-lactamase class C family)